MAGRVKHNSNTVRLYSEKKRPEVEFNEAYAKELLESSIIRSRGLSREIPTGFCYDCGKKVTGQRKTCGRCLALRTENRER